MGYFLLGSPKSSAWPWLTQNPITQPHGVNGEMGIDLGMPVGTPITALLAGRVVGAGYYGGGGVVSVEFRYKGKPAVLYYQHLDLIASNITVGEAVQVGQVLGYSGGQLSGGHHPSTPQFSDGPHIEVGINPPWHGFWNPQNYGPNDDPEPFLRSLAQSGAGAGFGGVSAQIAYTVSNATTPAGFSPIAESVADALTFMPAPSGADLNPLDYAHTAFSNFGAFFGRAMIAGIGVVVVIGVAVYLLREPIEQGAEFGAKAAMLAGGV